MNSMMASMGIWALVVIAIGLFVIGLVIYWAVRFALRDERTRSDGRNP